MGSQPGLLVLIRNIWSKQFQGGVGVIGKPNSYPRNHRKFLLGTVGSKSLVYRGEACLGAVVQEVALSAQDPTVISALHITCAF